MSGVPIVAVKIEHYCFNHSERAPTKSHKRNEKKVLAVFVIADGRMAIYG
ncbi:hypothetical protein [Endozoicomonas sp.]